MGWKPWWGVTIHGRKCLSSGSSEREREGRVRVQREQRGPAADCWGGVGLGLRGTGFQAGSLWMAAAIQSLRLCQRLDCL